MKKLKKLFSVFAVVVMALCATTFTGCGAEPTELSSEYIKLEYTSIVYDGTEKKPTVKVEIDEEEISADEYTVEYSSNKNVGTASVKVTAKEDSKIISGTVTVQFEITHKLTNVSTIDELKTQLTNDDQCIIVLQANLDLKDVNGNTALKIESGNHIIDLNGYKITGVDNGSNSWHALDVRGASTEVTIKDSSEAQTGTIEGRCYGIQVSRGAKLTIDGGNFTCVTNGTYNQSVVVYGGTLVVNGGTFKSRVYEVIYSSSYVWDTVEYISSVTINDGTFTHVGSGEEDSEYGLFYFEKNSTIETQNVTINGGTFNKNNLDYVVCVDEYTTFTNNANISSDLICEYSE